MKILQINAVYGQGSTGAIVRDIDLALQNAGAESYVACSRQRQKLLPHNCYVIGNSVDYKIHALYTRLAGKQAYGSTISTLQLLKYMERLQPDIVHLHNLHSNYINLNLLLSYLADNNIKTIITLHDCWFFTGKCFHFSLVGCMKWKEQCGSCPKLKDYVPSWFFDQTSKVYEDKKIKFNAISNLVVVSPSKWMSDQAEQSILKDKLILTINNGVDISVFYPRNVDKSKFDFMKSKRFIIIGIASKWLHEQNKNTLDYVAKQLDSDSMLLLIGCNEKQINNLPPSVVGMSFVTDRDKLAEIYSLGDVFVNVSWEDTFPTVNIESICCGTPVVTYNTGGSPEVIDVNTGYTVPQGDYFELWRKISEVKKKGKEYYVHRCAKTGHMKFNKNDRYEEYIDLYNRIFEK